MAFRIRLLVLLGGLLFAVNVSAQSNDTAATVPTSFLGTYTTTYDLINAGGPFSQGEEVTFVLGADNTLCINGQVLTNPVHPNGNPAEAVWTDSTNNHIYGVSNFSSTFNEVNIGGPNYSPFYGQLSGSKSSDSTSCSTSTAQQTPEITADMNTVFSMAESKLPDLFPSGPLTLTLNQYVYRLYSTGIYLAFADGNVLLLGGSFGDSIVNAGSISSVITALQAYPDPGGGGSASTEVWNLTISGSFDTSFIQNLTFGGISLSGIPAPNLDNTSEINQEIYNTMTGVATNIGTINVTIVENSSTRRAFDVSFTASTIAAGTVTYNLRYDYTR